MTRILSYNILVGGTNRVDRLAKIIRSSQPDIVGLIEAVDEQVVKELARELGMQYRLSGRGQDEEGWQAAILSRLPILYSKTYTNEILTKQPLLEAGMQEPNGQCFTVFVTHLTADFGKGKKAYLARRREVQEILQIMAAKRGIKHILMGDFNSLAPGECLKGSSFVKYSSEPNLYYQLNPSGSIQPPDLNFVLPPSLRVLKPLLEFIPRSKILSNLLDGIGFFYTPRGGIDLLSKAGYVDCFRFLHPHEKGFTWPAPIPSGRVDFIFASSELALHLSNCEVIVEGEETLSETASDHLPLFADFKKNIEQQTSQEQMIRTQL